MDSNLLKEAIADAKAVRQTALANAKVALEEQFSEKYQAMFAQKLKEDAEQEETFAPEPTDVNEEEVQEDTIGEQEIDELIKELEAEVGDEDEFSAAPMGGGDELEVPEAPVEDPAAAAEAPACVPGCVVPPAAPEVPEPVDGMEAPEAMPSSEVPMDDEELDEDIDLDALLESLKQELGEEVNEEEEVAEEVNEEEEISEEDTIDEQTALKSSAIGGSTGGSDNKEPQMNARSSSKLENGSIENCGVPSPGSSKVEKGDASRPNKGANATATNQSTKSIGGSEGGSGTSKPNTKGSIGGTSALKEENESLKTKLTEATDTIKYIKGQLNEINLLNAKLLYTNKLFKEFSMGNDQKMRVVEMFDLSKNVREVKLTYANIAESLNFGGTGQKAKTKTAGRAQQITEGLASQPVGSTKPSSEIISESKNAMVSKFQKLAGIRTK